MSNSVGCSRRDFVIGSFGVATLGLFPKDARASEGFGIGGWPQYVGNYYAEFYNGFTGRIY